MDTFNELAGRAIAGIYSRAAEMPVHFVKIETKPVVRTHLIINCVLAFFACVVVITRIYGRISGGGVSQFGLDDFFICLALPQALAMLVIQGIVNTSLGVGYPLSITMVNIPLILRLLVAYELIFATSTLTIKLSALFFYLRVFVNRGLQLATKCVIIFVMLWSVANIFQVFLICKPFKATYDPFTKGTCGSQKASFIAIGSFNAVTDIMILMLPIHTVWTLKARLGMKIALTGVFMIGFLVTIVSVCRIYSLTTLDLATNLTGTMIYASFLSATEPLLGILCISLPMLRPTTHFRCLGMRTTNDSNKNSYNPADLKTFGSSAKPKRLAGDDTFAMETIYAENMQVGYTVETTRAESRNSQGTHGSETELTNSKENEEDHNITVQRKWVVSHV